MASDEASKLIVSTDKFDCSIVQFKKATINKQGGKQVGVVNKDSKSPLMIFNDEPILCWGVNEWVGDDGRKTYDLSIQFPQSGYETESSKKFLEKMVAFENLIIEQVINNSKEYLNKAQISRDVAEALFTPMLKYPKDQQTGEPDKERSPTMKIKLRCWDGEFTCECYDLKRNTLFQPGITTDTTPVELIKKGCQIIAIIRCCGIWFINGKFGVSWELQQVVVKPKISLTGKCFIPLSKKSIETMEAQKDSDDDDDDGKKLSTHADDSDDDIEPEKITQEVKEEITPEAPEVQEEQAPVKKKVVRKKKVAD